MLNRIQLVGITTLILILGSCSSDDGSDLQSDVDSEIQTDRSFDKGSYDGTWGWYENKELKYRVIIFQGQITELQPASRTAQSINYKSSYCSLNRYEGLSFLEFRSPKHNDPNTQQVVMFRFDEDPERVQAQRQINSNVLVGFMEAYEQNDNFPTPSQSRKSGYLKRISK